MGLKIGTTSQAPLCDLLFFPLSPLVLDQNINCKPIGCVTKNLCSAGSISSSQAIRPL